MKIKKIVNNSIAIATKNEYLYSSTKSSILANLITSFFITLFLYNSYNSIAGIKWFLAIFISIIIRLITLYFYNRSSKKNTSFYYNIFVFLVFLTAVIWGLSGFIIFTPNNQVNMLILVSILGVSMGGLLSLSVDLKSIIIYETTVLIPLIIKLLLDRDDSFRLLGLLIFIFYILILMFIKRINKMIYENITYKQKHKSNLEKLKNSEAKFRTIFDSAPVGIFYYNSDLIIYDCNDEFCNILESPKDKLLNFDMHKINDTRIIPTIKNSFENDNQLYEGEYKTTISKTTIWILMICSPLHTDKNEIKGAVGIIQNRTDIHKIENEIRYLAYHDNLTNLPNRLLLKDRTEQALSQSKRNNMFSAILFLDLDNFKNINDTLGHHVGDIILKEVSDRISNILRLEDTVARLGGDEFVVLLPRLHLNYSDSLKSVNLVASKIHNSFKEPFQYKQNKLYTSSSIGVVLFSKDDNNFEDLLKHADTAMYDAKSNGKSCTSIFDKSMNNYMNKKLELETALRLAIKKQEFQAYFQPIIGFDGKIIGAETLVRWISPKLGLISPIDFIPIAEETNLILDIGEFLIIEVLKNLNLWLTSGYKTLNYISINISVNQLRQENFLDIIKNNINKFKIPPNMIVLEITENILIGNFDKISRTISTLSEFGVRFALDDFGTGYSSLTYLKKLKLDILKIDKAFIDDIITDKNDANLVEAIINIANNFDLSVVAEGVEKLEQIEFLKTLNCKNFQGYYYSKPIPLKEFTEYLKINL